MPNSNDEIYKWLEPEVRGMATELTFQNMILASIAISLSKQSGGYDRETPVTYNRTRQEELQDIPLQPEADPGARIG